MPNKTDTCFALIALMVFIVVIQNFFLGVQLQEALGELAKIMDLLCEH